MLKKNSSQKYPGNLGHYKILYLVITEIEEIK